MQVAASRVDFMLFFGALLVPVFGTRSATPSRVVVFAALTGVTGDAIGVQYGLVDADARMIVVDITVVAAGVTVVLANLLIVLLNLLDGRGLRESSGTGNSKQGGSQGVVRLRDVPPRGLQVVRLCHLNELERRADDT